MRKIQLAFCLLLILCGKQNIAFTNPTTEVYAGVDLVSFEAIINFNKVDIKWVTKTEDVNALFVIEKSKDGVNFEEVMRVTGAGKGNLYMEYFDADYKPSEGISYYRLKQSNETGEEVLHNIIAVNYFKPEEIPTSPEIVVSKSPKGSNSEFNMLLKGFEGKEVLVVLRNKKGDEFFSKVFLSSTSHDLIGIDPDKTIPSGDYLITASVNNKIYSKRIKVR